MAMTFTAMNKLNLAGLNDVIVLTVGAGGEISDSLTVMNGIENNTPIVSLTAKDYALRLSAGCSDPYKYDAISDKVKYYEHSPIHLPLVVCLQDLWGKMVAKGINLDDSFSETELAGFIQVQVNEVLDADMLRLAWLDGADVQKTVNPNAAAYGILKHGGFIQQHLDSTETQGALVLDKAGVLNALRSSIDSQNTKVLADSEFFVSTNVMRLYKNLLQDRDNSVAQVTMTDGKPTYFFEGYKITALNHVSNAAKTDSKYDAFVAFAPKSNQHLAMESGAVSIDPFIRDAQDRKYYSTTLFAATAMLVEPSFMQLWLHEAV